SGVFSVSRMTRASARTTARTEIPADVLDGSAGGGADMVRPLSGKAVPPDSAFHDGGGGNGQDGAVLFFGARRHRGNLSCRGRLFRLRPVLLRRREQPRVNVVGDGLQARVANRLAVHRGHVGYFMTHNVVDGGLVLGLVGHRAEGVAER